MIYRQFIVWQLCFWVGQVNGADITTEQPLFETEMISSDVLARRLIDQHDSLAAISLVYTQVPRSVEEQPTGDYLRRFVAASREGMFIRDNSHGNSTVSWTKDSFRKTLVVTPAGSTLVENLNRCVTDLNYELLGEAPTSISVDYIFDVLCWWPFVNWSTPRSYEHAFSMKVLLNEGVYQVNPQKETVGSRPCYAFKVNDIYSVWCDCDRLQCVLRSEIHNPATKSLAAKFEMTDHQQYGDGIWLPGRFRIVRLDSDAHTPQLRERVVYDRTFVVSDIKINDDVSAAVFQQNYDPGTIRLIESANEVRYEPVVEGQAEHFDSILKWCRILSPPIRAKRGDHAVARQSTFFIFALIGFGLVIAVARTRSSPPS